MAGLDMLPLGTAHSCPAWQRQHVQAEGVVKLPPAAQDAASRSSGAHVARGFLSSFSLAFSQSLSESAVHSKKGLFILAVLWSGLPWKEGTGSVLLQTCLVKAE